MNGEKKLKGEFIKRKKVTRETKTQRTNSNKAKSEADPGTYLVGQEIRVGK